MHRRHQFINIPTEIVRTVVVITETGSYTKAGERLGLSQPAITAHIKCVQSLVGGPVFERAAGGVSLTNRGKLVLSYARKLLDANDQILGVGGVSQDRQSLRVGLAPLYVEKLLPLYAAQRHEMAVNFHCVMSWDLAKGLSDGYLDMACLLTPPLELNSPISPWEVASWEEEFVWVRSPDFVISPGAPIPIVVWPGSQLDDPLVKSLEKAGLAYRVVFAAIDYRARISAVQAGLGLMQLPLSEVKAPLCIANEYYLPRLEKMRAAIVVRPDMESHPVKPMVDLLRMLAPVQALDRKQAV